MGIVTKQGDAIVLVGPAAFRTDAPLCLDVNAGLYSAVLMATQLGAKGVDGYNAAFAREAIDLVKASRPNAVKAQVTLDRALGLVRTNSRVREKCMGKPPVGNMCASVLPRRRVKSTPAKESSGPRVHARFTRHLPLSQQAHSAQKIETRGRAVLRNACRGRTARMRPRVLRASSRARSL